MAKRKFTNKLIRRKEIKEDMRLIKDSLTDYITPTGAVYKDYGNGLFFPKRNFINKHNGYVYTVVTYPNGNKQRRVHILVAESWISNPENKPIVMHKDNNKQNNSIDNLKWGTISENTKQAYDDGLAKNDKGFQDSQAYPVVVYDVITKKPIKVFGSCRICAKELGVAVRTITLQCKNHTPTRKPYYFRFLKDTSLNKEYVC